MAAAFAFAAEIGGLLPFLLFALELTFKFVVVIAADGVLVAEFDVGLRAALNGDADMRAAWNR